MRKRGNTAVWILAPLLALSLGLNALLRFSKFSDIPTYINIS